MIKDTRRYNLQDKDVENLSLNILKLYRNNKDKFVSLFPKLDDEFLNEWKKELNVLKKIEEDRDVLGVQQKQTEMLYKSLQNATEQMNILLLYAKISFPANRAKMKAFGKSDFSKVRYSAPKMLSLMKNTLVRILLTENLEKLHSNGFDENRLKDFKKAISELEININKQAEIKSLRPIKTQERIAAYNKLWERLELVSNAAKLVFADDKDAAEKFLLYSDRKRK